MSSIALTLTDSLHSSIGSLSFLFLGEEVCFFLTAAPVIPWAALNGLSSYPGVTRDLSVWVL